jgi:hypothetical protein
LRSWRAIWLSFIVDEELLLGVVVIVLPLLLVFMPPLVLASAGIGAEAPGPGPGDDELPEVCAIAKPAPATMQPQPSARASRFIKVLLLICSLLAVERKRTDHFGRHVRQGACPAPAGMAAAIDSLQNREGRCA